jgi:small subunit ribosomal protein S16
VAVKIKLKRLGKIREPYYRIVVADARTKRDGRAIEEIGKYHPKADPSLIEVDSARVQHWLSVGAQPTDPVRHLLTITGDWQKFKGLPGAEGTLKTAEQKAVKKDRYDALVKESLKAKETKETKAAAKPARSAPKKDQPKNEAAAEAKADGDAAEAKAGKAAEAKAGKAAEAKAGKAAEAKADGDAADAKASGKAAEAKAGKAAKADGDAAEAKADGKAAEAPEAPEAPAAEAADGGTGA